ncbi:MAG TPA: c-type cytochrome [Epsilonproteobacteria bacterium]|nr:c-type cytochrome [Campylobacterota bacterium]
MKTIKLLLAGLAMTMTLQAQTGAEIFKDKCVTCHMLKPMMDKTKMQAMSKEDRMAMKEKMMKMMKAPPMSKVSAKVKFELKNNKAVFIAFVKDYIVNPSKEKSYCMPMALQKFGVMPAIGKNMSEEELDTIANWLYDNFTEKWDMNDKGMMCKMKGEHSKSMKCAQGKCGNSMKKPDSKMKCAEGKCAGATKMVKPKASKCGASHKEESAGKCAGNKSTPKKTPKTMKCGQGKCGGNK